jgi:pyrroloquinoline-quinone synthase
VTSVAFDAAVLDRDRFIDRLRVEGKRRYHDVHPFHVAMHAGRLSKAQIQGWVLNRFYYQTRVPIKDAIILSKSTDPAFRRLWIHRIVDHDGVTAGEGGLALWLKLAEGVGLDPDEVASLKRVLPGVRFACDAYVQLVRERSLVEAVASSLTEFFAPDIMATRLAAWQVHYPWVDPGVQEYFRTRVVRARGDSQEAIEYVLAHAKTREVQESCIAAFVTKCDILWALLDAVAAAYPS